LPALRGAALVTLIGGAIRLVSEGMWESKRQRVPQSRAQAEWKADSG
jgi:hypothetical protein